MSWRQQQTAIMTDSLSGAMGVTAAACDMLLGFLDEERFSSTEALADQLTDLALQVLTAQSGMASLVNLFNAVFLAIGQQRPREAQKSVRKVILAFQDHQQTARQQIIKSAAALLAPSTTVITTSASSTVRAALVAASEERQSMHVFCTESRPLFEGRQQATALAEAGLAVTLIVDAAFYANLDQIQLALLGGDGLTSAGLVSKIGTAGLAVCCRSWGIPCYVLADTYKIWPADLGDQPIHQRRPAEIWNDAPDTLTLQNHYFDVTPWTAISGIITENGILPAEAILTKSRKIVVHPRLQSVMTQVRSTL
jgi:translation initiation factor 2B subunit (eIF-2B alpha/beta/delta family)